MIPPSPTDKSQLPLPNLYLGSLSVQRNRAATVRVAIHLPFRLTLLHTDPISDFSRLPARVATEFCTERRSCDTAMTRFANPDIWCRGIEWSGKNLTLRTPACVVNWEVILSDVSTGTTRNHIVREFRKHVRFVVRRTAEGAMRHSRLGTECGTFCARAQAFAQLILTIESIASQRTRAGGDQELCEDTYWIVRIAGYRRWTGRLSLMAPGARERREPSSVLNAHARISKAVNELTGAATPREPHPCAGAWPTAPARRAVAPRSVPPG